MSSSVQMLPPPKCLIAEDHMMFAQLVGGLLSRSCPIDLVGITTSVAESLPAIDQHRPQLLILDLVFPDGSGLEVAEHLVTVMPAAKVLVLSAFASQFLCSAALQASVLAVIDKSQVCEVLVDQVAAFVASLGAVTGAPRGSSGGLDGLTGREREVLRHLGRGDATKTIAQALGVTVRTVETYRRNIAAKLGVSGAELIRFAVIRTFHELPPPVIPPPRAEHP